MTGEELKALRIKAGLTQEELAELVAMHKNTIYSYENKQHVPLKKSDLLRLSLQNLITKKGLQDNHNFVKEENEDYRLDQIKINQPLEFFKTKAGTLYEQLPNGKHRVHVPRVPFKAYASFIEVFEDEYQLHESFEQTYFTVDHVGLGKYIAFITANESMNGGGIYDTPGGAEVLARNLGKHHWADGFRPTDYGWIIVSTTGIFHKDIENTDTPGLITCKSRNPSPEFSEFKLILDNVHSIWKVIKRTF